MLCNVRNCYVALVILMKCLGDTYVPRTRCFWVILVSIYQFRKTFIRGHLNNLPKTFLHYSIIGYMFLIVLS